MKTLGLHYNSLESFKNFDKETRRNIVLNIYKGAYRPLTDREVKRKLGFQEMNSVRPRVTELVALGFLVEDGKIKDFMTGVMVRTCRCKDKLV